MIYFYNTLSRKKEAFQPLNPNRVTMYVCGLTPYDHAHLGHARTYCAFDMIKRYLLSKGYSVYHIQNITDIDDKILRRARETNKDPRELADVFHGEALSLFEKLRIIPADIYPRVTDHIPDIIAFIEKLIEKGFAYETATGVYFSVPTFSDYGKLSHQSLEKLKAGARIEPDETKRDPRDFALWKKGRDVLCFDSPWGIGRPGWHIECSTMAIKYGGETIDIHGGAKDLIFPHHENEIAQSEAFTGKPFVRYWLHTGFLTVEGEKMSKSLGNFIILRDVLAKRNPLAVRLFFAMTHYRSPIDYNESALAQMEETAEKIKAFWKTLLSSEPNKNDGARSDLIACMSKIEEALADDFNMPLALAEFFKLIHRTNAAMQNGELSSSMLTKLRFFVSNFLFVLGFPTEVGETKELAALIELLVQVRAKLRKEKRYELADEIRNHLKDIGVILNDSGDHTTWTIVR